MRIATYNTEFLFGEGTHQHSGKDWTYTPEYIEKRIAYFAEKFKKINADILLLQEVASEEVVKRIIERSGIIYNYFFATPANNVGNVVLYKDSNAICDTIPAMTYLPVFVEGDADVLGSSMWSRRDFVYLRSTHRDKPLHVLGIHIKSNFLVALKNVDGEGYPIETQQDAADSIIRSELFRYSQAKKVREMIDGFFAEDPDAQVIVGGDFNAWESTTVYRIIKGVVKDRFDTLYTSAEHISPQKRYINPIGTLVDHILLSDNLKTTISQVQVFNEDIVEHKHTPDTIWYPGSDHPPVVVDLVMDRGSK